MLPKSDSFFCSRVFKRKSRDATPAGGPRVWGPGWMLSKKHIVNIMQFVYKIFTYQPTSSESTLKKSNRRELVTFLNL